MPATIRSLGELTPKDIANGVVKELLADAAVGDHDPDRSVPGPRARQHWARAPAAPGTEFKISGVYLTVQKTRLNDPGLWLMGPNDVGGDFRAERLRRLPRAVRERS